MDGRSGSRREAAVAALAKGASCTITFTLEPGCKSFVLLLSEMPMEIQPCRPEQLLVAMALMSGLFRGSFANGTVNISKTKGMTRDDF